MGLLDRIQAAKKERGDSLESRLDQAINAGAPAAEGAEAGPRQEWGKPGRCPDCGGRGYLDHIDLVDRIMYQHCTECRHTWEISESEVATAQ
jgi:hypothetical protein